MNPRTHAPAGQPLSDAGGQAWRDPSRPAAERVADLLARMTLDEKAGQLVGIWVRPAADGEGDGVAPMQGELDGGPASVAELISHGVGQLTRVFGTVPLRPAAGVEALARLQDEVVAASRFGIPAIAHEECLTGFEAWTATAFPTALAWGASFDPDLVREMAAAIGQDLRAVGVHQGLAPVLDVARDPRWGRVEETIGEDPYLVGLIGTAYVQGLQSAGVIATLKHFVGYSASRAGRNLAPVGIGPRELADVILPPFEMAIREGGARSVMPSYPSIDGVPATADPALLTGTLRDELGFDGVVVSDYQAIAFLETLHGVAGSPAAAAGLALGAGVDVELPHPRCFGAALAEAVRAGQVPERLVDRAVTRVLRQKCELGLFDPGWSPGIVDGAARGDGSRSGHGAGGAGSADGRGGGDGAGGRGGDGAGGRGGAAIDLDPPGHRRLARLLAEESIVLLANDRQALPVGAAGRLAVVGPLADDPLAFFGCYTFPRHVGVRHPDLPVGIETVSVLTALRGEFPAARISHARGCDVRSADRSGIAVAVACARDADLVIAVVGDEAGLFGRGTSGEGCDVADLRLPGAQQDLVEALIAAGRPVVLVAVTGRPYALDDVAGRLAAAVQAFFPGEEGAGAIAGVLSGRVVPSGKLPIEMPSARAGQPSAYLRAPLAGRTDVSTVDPTPLFPFGHGLSYTTFEYADLSIAVARAETAAPEPAVSGPAPAHASARIATDGAAGVACTVRNTGTVAGTETVQLYLRDPVAQVVRPVRYLAGFARVPLEPGQARRVVFRLHADRTSFHGRSGARIVEPGVIEVEIGSSSADPRLTGSLLLHGPEREVGPDRVLTTPVSVLDA
jgi:beta-xylosidase